MGRAGFWHSWQQRSLDQWGWELGNTDGSWVEGYHRERSDTGPTSSQGSKLIWKSQLLRRFWAKTKGDFPPCQPSLLGHCTLCKTCNCKTNIFFHCPSEPHGPSGRLALQAKPFYFSTPTASIQQSEVFHFHQRDYRERPRKQLVLSSSGQIIEPPATHSLPMPITGHSLLPRSAKCIPPKMLACLIPTSVTDQINVCPHFFYN